MKDSASGQRQAKAKKRAVVMSDASSPEIAEEKPQVQQHHGW
jgi:hypothetical protein